MKLKILTGTHSISIQHVIKTELYLYFCFFSSWNDEPGKPQRNWRWSESPDRESIGQNLEQVVPSVQKSHDIIKRDDSIPMKSSGRKRRHSPHRSSRKKSRSRSRSKSKRKKEKRSHSRSRSRKKSKKSSKRTPDRRRK